MKIISKKLYKKFIDTGQIPSTYMYKIAQQVIDGVTLHKYSLAVFMDKTNEINFLIKSIHEYGSE